MMNDEYLWNKTGSDAEIEGLENELRAFRYQETEALRIPVQAVSVVERRPNNFFRLGFAFVFAAAVVVILSGGWFLLPADDSAINDVAVNSVRSLPLADISPDTHD